MPWLNMLKCAPLWAILITQCGQSWAFYTQLTELPTYMAQILHFDIQAVSFHNKQFVTFIGIVFCRTPYFQPFHILPVG